MTTQDITHTTETEALHRVIYAADDLLSVGATTKRNIRAITSAHSYPIRTQDAHGRPKLTWFDGAGNRYTTPAQTAPTTIAGAEGRRAALVALIEKLRRTAEATEAELRAVLKEIEG